MNSKLIIPSIALAAALSGCGKKVQDIDVTLVETSQTCNQILFKLAENCTTKGEVRGVNLSGTSKYSVAGLAGRENDTGSLKQTDIDTNTANSIAKIKQVVYDKVDDENWLSTDITTKITGITLNGKADGYSSVVGNMDGNIYEPGYGMVDSTWSEKTKELNKVNAISRCNETINTIGKNITPNVVNNVKCDGEVIPFSHSETSKLLTLGGWILETFPEYRVKNVSPAIIAFSYIKGIESGKVKKEPINSILGEKELDEAISIVRSKHFVKIDGVKANIGIEINENKVSNLGKGLFGLGGMFGILFGVLAERKRRKNK